MNKRQKLKSENRCVDCGKQDARTLAGMYRCNDCNEKEKERKERRFRYREEHGLCFACGMQDERTKEGEHYCCACLEKKRKNVKARREYYLKLHRCGRCGKQDAYTLNGKTLCADCSTDKIHDTLNSRENDDNKSYNAYMQWYRAYRKERGICQRCGRDIEKEYVGISTNCSRCKSIIRNKHVASRIESGMNWPRGGNGYCIMCNKKKAIEGKRMCEDCYERAKERIYNVNKLNAERKAEER